MSTTQAAEFAESAIALIESDSIREWARSARNLPIITKMAFIAISRNPKAKPQDFATALTLAAMG